MALLRINSLPKNKIVNSLKSNAVKSYSSIFGLLEDTMKNILNSAKMMISVSDRLENIVGKENMLVASIFSFSHNVFKSVPVRVVKTRYCLVND